MAYFPMFVDMKQKNCLIVGGGLVALRKARMMLEFEAHVHVIAPVLVKELHGIKGISVEEREFSFCDLDAQDMVIAATNLVELNEEIATACKKRGIPVNVVNRPEAGSFICPAYEKTGSVVAAFSSGGKNPAITQYLKKKIKPWMTKELAEQAEYLGSIRPKVKQQLEEKGKRKLAYEQLLAFCQKENRLPKEEEFLQILGEIKKSDSN